MYRGASENREEIKKTHVVGSSGKPLLREASENPCSKERQKKKKKKKCSKEFREPLLRGAPENTCSEELQKTAFQGSFRKTNVLRSFRKLLFRGASENQYS